MTPTAVVGGHQDTGPIRKLEVRERWALALLALGGCAFLPEALDRFVFPKLAVVTLGALLALSVRPRGRLPLAAILTIGAGALLLVVAALSGPTQMAQLIGRPPRYEGFVVLPVYVACVAAGARLLGQDRAAGATGWFLKWLSVAAVAIAVEAVLESAGLRPLASNVARPGSLLGNASDEGAWAVLALGPLASVALRTGGGLRVLGALAAATAVACSGSRGALAGLVGAAAVLMLLTPRPALRVILVCSVLVVAVGVLALPETRARVLGTSPLAAQTAKGREMLWSETLQLIADKPLLGAGPSGYIDTIPAYHTAKYERQIGPANPPESPHNVLLQAAVAGGIGLALLAVVFAGLTFRSGLLARREQKTGGEEAFVVGIVAGLAGYGVSLLFFFTTPGTTPLAAVLAGALLSRPLGTKTPMATRLERSGSAKAPGATGQTARCVVRRATQILLACFVALFVAAAVAEIPLRLGVEAAASDDFTRANEDFSLARDLTPWDGNVAAVATHAYAQLVRFGIPSAAAPGIRWSAKALQNYPSWVQALADAAALDAARGKRSTAATLFARARGLDPQNPELRSEERQFLSDTLSSSP
jgi:O-antigen ligase